MLTLHDGVVGVVRVLLLDDRVEDGMTVDAARHIASLFSTPLRRAWLLKEGSVTYTKCLGLDEQALLLSVQLVDLMASDTETSLTPDEERVQFRSSHLLQQQKINQEKRFLKRETIQERLHLGIATIFNATLHLMPRSEDKSLFAAATNASAFTIGTFSHPHFASSPYAWLLNLIQMRFYLHYAVSQCLRGVPRSVHHQGHCYSLWNHFRLEYWSCLRLQIPFRCNTLHFFKKC
ncbi:hypothetical protein TCDM_01370 [Trypanosoma cruzi Dm28c]|uniref:Uncharacterized protein n=1 Tax=Trypanosoma cruzi Dm28c TaxID=1416333 RepID=V5BQ18_TRYCR|nr:hypothetical protein TCDM_01370 [Trypanosoma cruzi Dm28c]